MNELRDANFIDIALLLFDYLVRYRVEGDSMLPLLGHGEQVLVDENARIKIGDIVIAAHPFKKNVEMIKRVAQTDENGNYFLLGDNPNESTDSRSFGFVKKSGILGKVKCRLK